MGRQGEGGRGNGDRLKGGVAGGKQSLEEGGHEQPLRRALGRRARERGGSGRALRGGGGPAALAGGRGGERLPGQEGVALRGGERGAVAGDVAGDAGAVVVGDEGLVGAEVEDAGIAADEVKEHLRRGGRVPWSGGGVHSITSCLAHCRRIQGLFWGVGERGGHDVRCWMPRR